jgi:serine/threonine-protein kinase
MARRVQRCCSMAIYRVRGSSIGDYRIELEVARTPTAVIYRAVHNTLGRTVALKVAAGLPKLRGAHDQFVREADVLDRLAGSTGVARVYDRGVLEDGRPWFATDHVVGPSLAEVIASGAKVDAAYALGQIATTIAHAHARGIAHRNLRAEDVVCVVEPAGVRLVVTNWTTTRDLARNPSDAAADAHALGVIALQMLTGVMAFSSGTLAMLAGTTSLRFPRAAVGLTALVDRMLSRDVRVRPSALEVVAIATSVVAAARQPARQHAPTQAFAVPRPLEVEVDAEITRIQQVA